MERGAMETRRRSASLLDCRLVFCFNMSARSDRSLWGGPPQGKSLAPVCLLALALVVLVAHALHARDLALLTLARLAQVWLARLACGLLARAARGPLGLHLRRLHRLHLGLALLWLARVDLLVLPLAGLGRRTCHAGTAESAPMPCWTSYILTIGIFAPDFAAFPRWAKLLARGAAGHQRQNEFLVIRAIVAVEEAIGILGVVVEASAMRPSAP